MHIHINDAFLFGSNLRDPYGSVDIDAVKKCPLCLTSFNGEYVIATLVHERLYVTHYCAACEQVFLGIYQKDDSPTRTSLFLPTDCLPKSELDQNWPTEIRENFPEFISSYEEALQAELHNLKHLCGMGYRKALEVLIKDYMIRFTDNNKDDIMKMLLGQCIRSIDNPKIKTVASRSAWLGNDYSHYSPKFGEYNLSDLKKFIDAVAYWISIEIITRNAAEIQPR